MILKKLPTVAGKRVPYLGDNNTCHSRSCKLQIKCRSIYSKDRNILHK